MNVDKIPAIPVVEWQYKALFGRMKMTWVLPPVKVAYATPTQHRMTLRERLNRNARSV